MAVLPPQTGGAPGASMAPGGPDLVGYLLTCGFVLALVLGAAWLLRRFLSGALKARAAARSLSVVDVLPLGGRQRLVVVRCYDRTFLLGQGEKEVRAIGELDVEASPATQPAAEETEDGSQARTAASAFARLLGRAGAGAPGTPEPLAPPAPLPQRAEPPPAPVRWSEPGVDRDERPRKPVLDGGKGILG